MWRSNDLNQPFERIGEAIEPRSNDVDDWDNHRIQEGELDYVPELGGYVTVCNMMDMDGKPGGKFPTLPRPPLE